MTFGRYIAQERKRNNLTQKDLAARIKRPDDDKPITPQYLNDIEHDRRSPSAPELIKTIAEALGVDADVLYLLAGRVPSDVSKKQLGDPDAVARAMRAFRRELRSTKGQ